MEEGRRTHGGVNSARYLLPVESDTLARPQLSRCISSLAIRTLVLYIENMSDGPNAFIKLSDVAVAMKECAGTLDVDAMTAIETRRSLAEVGAIRRLLDGAFIALSRRADEVNAHQGTSSRSPAELCSRSGGVSIHDARSAMEASRARGSLPIVEDAIENGELTIDEAARITKAAEANPDAQDALVASAKEGPEALKDACIKARLDVESSERRRVRQHQLRSLTMRTDDDGMLSGRFRLTPENGAQFKAIIDRHTQHRFRNQPSRTSDAAQLAADVLVDLVRARSSTGAPVTSVSAVDTTAPADSRPDHPNEPPSSRQTDTARNRTAAEGAAAGSTAALFTDHDPPVTTSADRVEPCRSGGVLTNEFATDSLKASINIVIDYDTLLMGEHTADGSCVIPGVGPVDPMWVRSLLGDAFVTALITKGTDIHAVAHFGRHINSQLRTALLARGQRCTVAGCQARGFLEIDHRQELSKAGPTSLANLDPLCSHHHRLKTLGWTPGPRHSDGTYQLQPPPRGHTVSPIRKGHTSKRSTMPTPSTPVP
jgi:hypothetical protein